MSTEMTPPDASLETLPIDATTERTEPVESADAVPFVTPEHEVEAPAQPTPAVVAAPRTRWAAIVWGLFFAAIAVCGLWLLADEDRRQDVREWVTALTPATLVAIGLLIVGVLALVAGLAGLIRHTQRKFSRRESGHAA